MSWASDRMEYVAIAATTSSAPTSSATASTYSARAVPGTTVESNTTKPISGRAAMLRECRAPGRDTQRKAAYASWANQTGLAQGLPSPSAVASVR
jgi:hypothetical protein